MKTRIGLVVVFIVMLVLVGCSSSVPSDDAVTGTINRLISVAQEAAPMAWAMARQRVAALVVMDFAVAGVMLAIDIALVLIWVKSVKPNRLKKDQWGEPLLKDDDYYATCAVLGLVGVIPTLIMFINLYENIGRIISPDYYALRVILELIPK